LPWNQSEALQQLFRARNFVTLEFDVLNDVGTEIGLLFGESCRWKQCDQADAEKRLLDRARTKANPACKTMQSKYNATEQTLQIHWSIDS